MNRDVLRDVPFTIADQTLSEAVIRAVRPTVRILIVVDGQIALEPGGSEFGISRLIDLLHSPPTPARFQLRAQIQVHLAQRGLGNPTVHPNAQRYEPTYENFRFTMDGFSLDVYDEVWLFGLWSEEHPGAMTTDERQVLSQWMDNGGGVFATGGHGTLGAALCKDVPRVRHMRRWTSTQNPPPQHGPKRHVTTQPSTVGQGAGYEVIPAANEEDHVPKPISPITGFLRNEVNEQGQLVRIESVHPLLCAVGGPITVLPDHPHEGEVADFVNIDILDGAEFPRNPTIRPRPQVVATTRSGRPSWSAALLQYEGGPVDATDFATIGAYDGQQVDIGRVVVDSTLHHWLDQNLMGLELDDLAKVQAYHLNVAIWLARPEHRLHVAMGSILTATLAYPGVIELYERVDDLRGVGVAVLEKLRRFLSDCEITGIVMNPNWNEKAPELEEPDLKPFPVDCLSCPSWDEVMAYLLGGMVESLREMTANYERKYPFESLEPKQIRQDVEAAVNKGASRGRERFAADLRASFAQARLYADYVESLGKDRQSRQPADEKKGGI